MTGLTITIALSFFTGTELSLTCAFVKTVRIEKSTMRKIVFNGAKIFRANEKLVFNLEKVYISEMNFSLSQIHWCVIPFAGSKTDIK